MNTAKQRSLPERWPARGQPLARRFVWIQLCGWALYGVLHFLAALPVVPAEDRASLAILNSIRAWTGLGISSLLPIVYRRLDGMGRPAQAGVIFGVCALLSQGWTILDRIVVVIVASVIDLTVRWSWFPQGIDLDPLVTLLAWSGAYWTVTSWNETQTHRRMALEQELTLRREQLQSLNQRLSPHLLFNALNTLRSLMAEDVGRAREMLTRLSAFLNATLAVQASTSLVEELRTVRAYLGIQAMRFEEDLELDIQVRPGAERNRVPSMVLQPLVENAIKYGCGHRGGPPRIRIRAESDPEQLRIAVSNTGRLLSDAAEREGCLGLSHVRALLNGFYALPASVDLAQEGEWVTARVVIRRPGRIACGS